MTSVYWRSDTRRHMHISAIRKRRQAFTCHPTFSNDPRGAVLKIRVPDGFSNSFGDDGIVMPS